MNPVQNMVIFLTWIIRSIVAGESFGTIAWQAVSRIPALIASLIGLRDQPTPDKIGLLLSAADNHLGMEDQAIDLVKSLPDDKEELLTDAALTVIEILVKNALKLPGYHIDTSTLDNTDG